MPNAPYHPIIYVRGYAMTQGEQDDTTADPFCGFNLGSTVFRATPEKNKPAKKFIFESPVLRLISDHGYADVFENGLDIMDPEWEGTIAPKSIVIYRYYEQASALLGTGKTPQIEDFARGLSDLVLRVRDLVCAHPDSGVDAQSFRCYLVAHSMGGLVCRAFLQNPDLGDATARAAIDKVYTYATPHNGIEVLGLNVPSWLSANDMNNFNRDRMAQYLKLEAAYKKTGRVDWLPESAFPSERFFCMVGTNRADYGAAAGLSRAFAGHGSDGLVKVENASVWGLDAKGRFTRPAATAYAYRSHSGYFGIVNSEEAYQNLSRFLFGDIRVDIWVDVDSVRVPAALDGKDVGALYQFELTAAPRGKRWLLTRRVAEEDSVACRTHAQLTGADAQAKSLYLSTVFLANRARVNPQRATLAYGMSFGVRVPDYEVEKRFWADSHYEGGYLFRDALVVEMSPPKEEGGEWSAKFSWQSDRVGQATRPLAYKTLNSGQQEMTVPFSAKGAPGITGQLRFVLSAWNAQD